MQTAKLFKYVKSFSTTEWVSYLHAASNELITVLVVENVRTVLFQPSGGTDFMFGTFIVSYLCNDSISRYVMF